MKQTEDPVDRLERMAGLYRQCLDLTTSALHSPEPVGEHDLEGLLEERGAILTRALKIQESLDVREKDGRLILEGVRAGDRPKIEALLDELRRVMGDLLDKDHLLMNRLGQELGLTAEKLERFRAGERVLRAYGPARGRRAKLVDRRE